MKIQVPNSLICNKSINSKSVYLYTYLKMSYDYETKSINVYSKKLLEKLKWKDNKTLKKYLLELKTNKYITYDFDELPIRDTLQINIKNFNKDFTELDKDIITKVVEAGINTIIKSEDSKETKTIDLKESALRLYFYYEKNFMSDVGYAAPSYRDIFEETGIRSKNVKGINDILKKNKLLDVSIGDWYYNDSAQKSMLERNKYVLLCSTTKHK